MNSGKVFAALVLATCVLLGMASSAQAAEEPAQVSINVYEGQVEEIVNTDSESIQIKGVGSNGEAVLGTSSDKGFEYRANRYPNVYVLSHLGDENNPLSTTVTRIGDGVATTGNKTFLYDDTPYRFKVVKSTWTHNGETHVYEYLEITNRDPEWLSMKN